MGNYRSASYQQDVMDELSKQAEILFYGPGFSGYNKNDSIDDVLAKATLKPDVIIVGHAWLNDNDGFLVDPHPDLRLSQTTLFKVVMLNKEYTNLDAKLDYIKRSQFNIGFTHHHETKRYSESTGIEFIFWPFAYAHQKFIYSKSEKYFDVGFSGVLQNLNKNALQTDIRIRIMKRFFFTFLDVPLIKKKLWKDLNLYWNSISRKKAGIYLSALLRKRKYLEELEYVEMLQNSKICINTLSPMGLISPRFFESMATGALVFCEESELYQNIFPRDIFVTFRKDLSDFDKKLTYYLTNNDDRINIVEKANAIVKTGHTWSKRITELLNAIEKKYA